MIYEIRTARKFRKQKTNTSEKMKSFLLNSWPRETFDAMSQIENLKKP
jgi:hypothetical protein